MNIMQKFAKKRKNNSEANKILSNTKYNQRIYKKPKNNKNKVDNFLKL